ncbi:MAG TPA: DUF3261 domain-containing protein [Rhodocyclaceae bacterium]|nr:DUF3261 domain-containing protein [Rhodocyclaceae bacterium]
MKKRILVLLPTLLSACLPGGDSCPTLPGGAPYCLQTAPQHFATLQKTSIRFGSQQLTLLTRVESDVKGLRFVGLTPFGQTIMSVSWENGRVHAELPPALQGKLDPAVLLALIQIAQWPAEQVRAGLGPHWNMTETPNRRQLQLATQDETMLDIRWEGSPPYARLTISAPANGFQMEATRLDDGDEDKP